MPTGPCARITDMVAHPLPGMLLPGPGSPTVITGFLPTWRGIPLAAVAGLVAASASANAAVAAASATPGFAAAQASAAGAMSSAMSALAGGCGADTIACMTPFPPTPHGTGVDITGSATVLCNFLPTGRVGDTILEAIGPPNSITMGEMTVIVGG